MLQSWDAIINTAMMGTDKKQVSIDEMPAGLQTIVSEINNAVTDKKAMFLQLAAIAYNYRQCGFKPFQKELNTLPAPAEEKAYCNEMAMQVLKDIISEDSIHLLKIWLQHCYEKQQIVQPGMVPVLLAKGIDHKKLQLLIAACCGKRGEWLGGFNAAWNFACTQTDEELWQTGTLDQRKKILRKLRHTDPTQAREWLQNTWPQEDANTKMVLLDILTKNVSDDDIIFLESLSTEKSKKIKDLAIHLLKQIPQSSIVRLYEKTLSVTVSIQKEKALLGMMTKTTLQCKLPESMDEGIYKSGIDKLSNNKDYTDDEYVVNQLAQFVPPSFWEQHLGMSPEQIIHLFQKETTGKKILPAIAHAAACLKDTKWAVALATHGAVFYADLVPLLPAQQQEAYSNKYFSENPDAIIQYATTMETAWSMDLTRNIFRHTAKNSYQYNKSFYNQNIHLIPSNVIEELSKLAPAEEYPRNTWINTSEYITKLIRMKTQTIKAFNS